MAEYQVRVNIPRNGRPPRGVPVSVSRCLCGQKRRGNGGVRCPALIVGRIPGGWHQLADIATRVIPTTLDLLVVRGQQQSKRVLDSVAVLKLLRTERR